MKSRTIDGGKEISKLKAEELENRVAPMLVVAKEDPLPEDSGAGGGGGIGDPVPSAPEQPGNSGPHRDKVWKPSL